MNLIDQLPVFAIVLPLLGAPVCVLVRRPIAAWAVALTTAWASFISAILVLQRVSDSGTIRYYLGGWEPPWGIEYRIDLLGAYVLLVVTVIAALVLVFARRSVEQEIDAVQVSSFYAVLLLVFAGLAGITITGDAFNLFVFLEISSLSSYALISMGRDRRALNAAFKYLVMGSIGATFILIGIGFLYMMTGTLNLQDLAERLPPLLETRTVRAGFAFLTVGIGLKLALFPLHLWLPNAYAYAPSVVTAFLAATATKVAVYAMLRFVVGVFGIKFALGDMPFDLLLMGLGLAGILVASLVAIFQNNLKRMLAYSSVAQIGYMALALGLASPTGVTAASLHLFNHALMKCALFLALGAVAYKLQVMNIREFAGLGRRMPWTMAGFVVGGLSLIGVPPTVGFVSKWYLLSGVVEQGHWLLAAGVVIGSLLALAYIWRVIETAYLSEPLSGSTDVAEAPLSMLVPIWILVAANIYFGIDTELTVGVVERATAVLIGGAS